MFDVFALCLSQECVFAGSLGGLVSSKPSSTGYLHSLAELGSSRIAVGEQGAFRAIASEVPNMSPLVKELPYPKEHARKDYDLPRMPPWFVHIGGHKLYQVLARILRLLGLSLIAGIESVPIYYFLMGFSCFPRFMIVFFLFCCA